MKKAMMNIGIIFVSVAAFFAVALALNAAFEYLYSNTSYIDWFYDLEAYSWICITICLIPALAVHTKLHKICFDKK